MAPEILKSCPFPQLFEHFRNFSHPDNELSTSDPEPLSELHERFGHKAKMTAVGIVSPPETRLKTVEADYLAPLASLLQWPVVAQAEIPLKPDYTDRLIM